MASYRIFGDQIHYHVITRCNNGEPLLTEYDDCQRVLEFLKMYADQYTCKVHNYVIMPSHVHLMLMTDNGNRLDQVLHDFCLAVARDYNKRHERAGHFWRHRYRCKIVDDDRYALACLRYIHRNPVSAGLVQNPDEWPWSAYRFYAQGQSDEIIEPHPSYLLIGETTESRREVWREIVQMKSRAPKAERAIFEGTWRDGSERFRLALMRTYKPITKFLIEKRTPNLLQGAPI